MNTRYSILLIGALATVSMSFTALVLLPGFQLGTIDPTPGTLDYTASQAYGRQVYVREGCTYCHSQQVRPAGFGSDQDRGWGDRNTLPGDRVFDRPHLLGNMRTGPDLQDIASRQPDRKWHLEHLYQPRSVSPGSVMPSFRHLFRVREAAEVLASEETVSIRAGFAPPDGQVVVATEEALALYDYLMTLHLDPIDLAQP